MRLLHSHSRCRPACHLMSSVFKESCCPQKHPPEAPLLRRILGVLNSMLLSVSANLLQPHADRSDAAVQMQAMQQLLWASPPGGQQTLQWPAWKQGFFFCKHPGLQWGLVQRQGGPCGVLAAVQVLHAALCSPHTSCMAPSDLHCI